VLIDPFPYKDVHTLATPKLCAPEWEQCGSRSYTPAQFNEIVEKTDIFNGRYSVHHQRRGVDR
jgi:hypothetical protein